MSALAQRQYFAHPNGHPLPGYLPPGYQPVHPSDGPVEGMLPPTSDCHGLLDWIGLEVERVNATTRIRNNSPCSVFPSILQWASDLSQGLLQLVGGIEPLRLMHLELSGQSGLQSQYRLELGKQSSIQRLLQRCFSAFRHKELGASRSSSRSSSTEAGASRESLAGTGG